MDNQQKPLGEKHHMDKQQNLPFTEEEPPSTSDLPSTLFRKKFYPETTPQDWTNWQWQNRIV